MGIGSSVYVPNAVDGAGRDTSLLVFPSEYMKDEILIVYGDTGIQATLRQAIQNSWEPGVQEEQNYIINFGKLKLKGKPFAASCCNSSKQAVTKTKLMRSMIEDLLRSGWCIKTCINFYRFTRCDSFLIQRIHNDAFDPKVCAVNLQSSDQIHLIGASSRLYHTAQNIITEYWPKGLKSHEAYDNDCYKLVMKRFPWRAMFIHENLANSRTVLLQIIKAVHAEGYTLLASGHVLQVPMDVDTLYFSRMVDHEPMGDAFMLGVQKHDYLYTIDASVSCVALIRQAITNSWPRGIHKEETIRNMTAIKLHGFPWNCTGVQGSVSRQMMTAIFMILRNAGWRIYGAIDMNLNLADANVFVMIKSPPVRAHVMAIKLTGLFCFRMINAPQEVITCIHNALRTLWPEGVRQTMDDGFPAFNFSKPLEVCQGIFCIIIEKLEFIGWRLISSADLSVNHHSSKNSRYPIDLHTIFFEKILDDYSKER